MKFRVGDRVKGTACFQGQNLIGSLGTIKGRPSGSSHYHVEWDKPRSSFHACGGKSKSGHGWNCPSDVLELSEITDWKIHMERLL